MCQILSTFIVSVSGNAPKNSLNLVTLGPSLTPQQDGYCLVSPNYTFSAGFYRVGNNAYSFAIWYTKTPNLTVVWMANRDQPINGRDSRLALLRDGNLALSAANGTVIWSTDTGGLDVKDAILLETGNLVQQNYSEHILWESFKFPTDTLLPWQPFTKNTQLVSRMSKDSFKPGYYRFYFDNDNVLRLIYDSFDVSSIYWPNRDLKVFENGRTSYNSTLYAVLDRAGRFRSSDKLDFNASDYGEGVKRRLTIDIDGNCDCIAWMRPLVFRILYGWLLPTNARFMACVESTACALMLQSLNAVVLPDSTDWFKGCQRNKKIDICPPNTATKFLILPHTMYYGYDGNDYGTKKMLEECRTARTRDCTCQGFAYRLDGEGICFPKTFLFNGRQNSHMYGSIEQRFDCP